MKVLPPHLSASMLADYRGGRMAVADRISASDHLAVCAVCRDELARAQTDRPKWRQVIPEPDEATLQREEMEALLDDTLDAAQSEGVAARLAASPDSAAELADLRKFQAEMDALPPRVYGPAAGELPAPGKIVAFSRWRWIPFAAAAAAVILVTTGWWTRHRAPGVSGDTLALWTGADGGEADLGALPGALRASVMEAARTGRLDRSSLPDEIRPTGSPLAGGTTAAAWGQVAPVGTRVREDRPRLRWTLCPGATDYVVYLKPLQGDRTLIKASIPGTQAEWRPPGPLIRGGMYAWQVEAWRGGAMLDQAPRPPLPEARFQVLDAARLAGLVEVERRYASYPLIMGVADARAGLSDAAAEEFGKLSRQHPESASASKLSRDSVSDHE